MMYATRDDLVARFGADEIDDLAGASSASPRILSALADAGAEIDAILASEYAVPLPGGTAYPALVAIASDIARLRLYDDAVPQEAVLERARRSRARLRELVGGRAELLTADGTSVSRRPAQHPSTGARTSVTEDSPLFRRRSLQ